MRQGYSGEYGPNIRKATKTDSFEAEGVRGLVKNFIKHLILINHGGGLYQSRKRI